MAKKLTEFKNPLTNSGGSIFDLSLWLGGILWVVMFGMIFAMGTKALSVIDKTSCPEIRRRIFPVTSSRP